MAINSASHSSHPAHTLPIAIEAIVLRSARPLSSNSLDYSIPQSIFDRARIVDDLGNEKRRVSDSLKNYKLDPIPFNPPPAQPISIQRLLDDAIIVNDPLIPDQNSISPSSLTINVERNDVRANPIESSPSPLLPFCPPTPLPQTPVPSAQMNNSFIDQSSIDSFFSFLPSPQSPATTAPFLPSPTISSSSTTIAPLSTPQVVSATPLSHLPSSPSTHSTVSSSGSSPISSPRAVSPAISAHVDSAPSLPHFSSLLSTSSSTLSSLSPTISSLPSTHSTVSSSVSSPISSSPRRVSPAISAHVVSATSLPHFSSFLSTSSTLSSLSPTISSLPSDHSTGSSSISSPISSLPSTHSTGSSSVSYTISSSSGAVSPPISAQVVTATPLSYLPSFPPTIHPLPPQQRFCAALSHAGPIPAHVISSMPLPVHPASMYTNSPPSCSFSSTPLQQEISKQNKRRRNQPPSTATSRVIVDDRELFPFTPPLRPPISHSYLMYLPNPLSGKPLKDAVIVEDVL